MKRSILVFSFLMLITLLAASGTAGAAVTPGSGGYAYMVDSDGDGIPNCQDSDYTPPLDGTGFQRGKLRTATTNSSEFAFRYTWNWRMPFMLGVWVPNIGVVTGAGYGPGDGTGNGGVGPGDGTGYGPGPFGTGDCDGDGPEGLVLRRGR